MKLFSVLAALVILASPVLAENHSNFETSAIDKAARPAYRAVEEVSDRIFDLMRSHLIGPMLPDRLRRQVARSPEHDSYRQFHDRLREKQSAYARRLREQYPIHKPGDAGAPAQMAEWQSWALEEQTSVLVDSIGDTLLERYAIPAFGRDSERYARDSRNWDPDLLASAGLVGGGLVYLNGLRARTQLGPIGLALKLRPGMRIAKALRSGSDAARVASFDLSYEDNPITLGADYGITQGQMGAERLRLEYRLRY
ncbi:MAG: hypothetical protein HY549_00660 [Elusimicrobia bacterium]|nr:hypothetical protein [Elusimicrobiota bacterium]